MTNTTPIAILKGKKTTLPALLAAARSAGIKAISAKKSIWAHDRTVRIDVAINPAADGNIYGTCLIDGKPLGDGAPEMLYGATTRSWRGFAADPAVKPASDPCPDCGAKPGEMHHDGCDVEPCPACGCQFLTCECETDLPPVPWDGQTPGERDCERLGWWVTLGPDGWTPCEKNTPGIFPATPDLNRLYATCVWDPSTRRWDPRTAAAGAKS